MHFLKETLDVMDNVEYMRNSYLIMDNAPIHKRTDIQEMVEKRGYRCVYLLPYSLELNPIEQLWSVVKSKLRDMRFFKKKHYKIALENLVAKCIKAIFMVLLSTLTSGRLFNKRSHLSPYRAEAFDNFLPVGFLLLKNTPHFKGFF